MTRKEEIQEKSENELGTINYQVGFSQGAQWADKTMIEKACEWLRENANNYIYEDYVEGGFKETKLDIDDLTETFKQAMMEE